MKLNKNVQVVKTEVADGYVFDLTLETLTSKMSRTVFVGRSVGDVQAYLIECLFRTNTDYLDLTDEEDEDVSITVTETSGEVIKLKSDVQVVKTEVADGYVFDLTLETSTSKVSRTVFIGRSVEDIQVYLLNYLHRTSDEFLLISQE